MRKMSNPLHKYTNLIKTQTFAIQEDLYEKIKHKRTYR